jgi:hypothetical protein
MSPKNALLNFCNLFACFRQYDRARFNHVTLESRFNLVNGTHEIRVGSSMWRIEADCQENADDAMDWNVTFRCMERALAEASLGIDLEVAPWSARNYVLMPAAVYNGNRFLARKIPYSPKLYFVQDIGLDKPIIISDVPRLNAGDGVSRIQERSGSMARPAIGFYAPDSNIGSWLLTAQGNALGDYGLGVEETQDRDKAILSIASPLVRELCNYRICDNEFPSQDLPAGFQAGHEVGISFRLHFFAAASVQSLFDRYAAIRQELLPTPEPRPVLPYSACFACQEEKFNRENFVPEHGYYSVGPRTSFLQDWQIGWTGGMISTYPLLFAGSETTRRNVLRNFDWLFPNGISPSGFFWDCGEGGTRWFGGDIRKPHTANWHLIRKSGDGVFYILKQFRMMEKLGIAIAPRWLEGTRRVCDALARLWERNGQFGQFVDSQSGEIVVGGSTSGAIIPAALSHAAAFFAYGGYLEIAATAAEDFYHEFTRGGLSCGGPGDALQNPDSESWYALVESYTALFESTGDRTWLDRACEAARQFSTWVVPYDFRFPPASTFGKAGIRSTGAVYANTQNKHAAPGICTFSGLALLKLFRATGDRFYLDLLRDIAFGLPQYLPHPLHPLGEAVFGRMCERVNLTDWEGPGRIGETLGMSTWAETSLMLTAVEIPGLYVRPDQALVVAFDHIVAEIVAERREEIVVRVHNPTGACGAVRIFTERESDAAAVLPECYLFGCREAVLCPGETKELTFPR